MVPPPGSGPPACPSPWVAALDDWRDDHGVHDTWPVLARRLAPPTADQVARTRLRARGRMYGQHVWRILVRGAAITPGQSRSIREAFLDACSDLAELQAANQDWDRWLEQLSDRAFALAPVAANAQVHLRALYHGQRLLRQGSWRVLLRAGFRALFAVALYPEHAALIGEPGGAFAAADAWWVERHQIDGGESSEPDP